MKRLQNFEDSQILNFVLSNNKLREKFNNYIYDSQISYINELLDCFNRFSVDYSIGICNRNYFCVKNSCEFLSCIQHCFNMYGCSSKEEKLLNQCEKLYNSNLFEFYVKKLASVFYNETIKPNIDFIEKCSYLIYQQQDKEDTLIKFVDDFRFCLQNFFIDNSNNLIEVLKH